MVALANGEVGRHFLLASPEDRGEAAAPPSVGALCRVDFVFLRSLESTPAPISVSVWSWFSSSISSIHGVRDIGVLDSSW